MFYGGKEVSENKNKNNEVKEATKEAVDSTPQIPDGANEIRETTGADMEVYDDYDVGPCRFCSQEKEI